MGCCHGPAPREDQTEAKHEEKTSVRRQRRRPRDIETGDGSGHGDRGSRAERVICSDQGLPIIAEQEAKDDENSNGACSSSPMLFSPIANHDAVSDSTEDPFHLRVHPTDRGSGRHRKAVVVGELEGGNSPKRRISSALGISAEEGAVPWKVKNASNTSIDSVSFLQPPTGRDSRRPSQGSLFSNMSGGSSVSGEPHHRHRVVSRDSADSGFSNSSTASIFSTRTTLDDATFEADKRRFRMSRPHESSWDEDDVSDGQDYCWMFTFPLPIVTGAEFREAKGQRLFEAKLRRRGLTVSEMLWRCFEKVLEDGHRSEEANATRRGLLQDVIGGPAPHTKSAPDDSAAQRRKKEELYRKLAHASGSEPLLETENSDDYSLVRARQCAIELFVATVKTLDESCRAAVKRRTRQETQDCRSPTTPTTKFGKQVEMLQFRSDLGEALCICLRLTARSAELLADAEDYPVQLSDAGVRKLGVEVDDEDHTPAYARYNKDLRKYYHLHSDPVTSGNETVLRQIDQIRILYDKLTDLVDFELLESMDIMTHWFPMHHRGRLLELQKKWGDLRLIFSDLRHMISMSFCWTSWHSQNSDVTIHQIRAYFGEETALYFLFAQELGRFAAYLFIPSLACFSWMYLLPAAYETPSYSTPRFTFSCIVMVWFRVFTKHWWRAQRQYMTSWGVDTHRASTLKELPNRRFRGDYQPSKIDPRKRVRGASRTQEFCGRIAAGLCTVAFVVALLMVVGLEHYAYNVWADPKHSTEMRNMFHATCLGILTGVQIKVVDVVWEQISNWVTDLECRQTALEFASSKQLKATVVKFITSMSTMVFFAFLQPLMDLSQHGLDDGRSQADSGNTGSGTLDWFRTQLSTQLRAIFITRFIVLGMLNRVLKPWVALKVKYWLVMRGTESTFSIKGIQELMGEYSPSDLHHDYLDLLLPLCFIIFFGMIFPLSIVLLLFLAAIQIRSDAWKLTHVCRRPYPRVVMELGFFDSFLEFCGHCMIFSNLGLVYVLFPHRDSDLASFLSLAMVGVLAWHFIAWLVPDKSYFVELEERRHEFQRHKLFFSGLRIKNLRVELAPKELARRTDFGNIQKLRHCEKGQQLMEGLGLA